MSDFTSLTKSLVTNIKIYQDSLHSAGLPPPSHSLDAPDQNAAATAPPSGLPDDVAAALADAKEAAYELYLLLLNPVEIITESFVNYGRALSLNYITRYRIAEKLKPGEKKAFRALAEECKLNENDLTRMLRLAMTEYIFEEPERGMVAHTKASIALITVPNLDAWTETFTSSCAAMAELPDAMEKWPGSEKELETASAMYRKQKGQPESFWQVLKDDPEQAVRFGKAMAFIASNPAVDVTGFIQAYDFSKLRKDAVFVDVGGSHGKAAIALAEAHPNIHCIVQDISEPVITAARNDLPAHLKDRVEYQVYDFFQEQPVKGADIYFFRWIFHDWSDTDCVKLLKTLVPSLKSGSRVLINDGCFPAHGGSTQYKQRTQRMVDLMMKSLANAKERNAEEWKALFDAADARFQFQPVHTPPKMQASLIEAIWDP